MRVKLEARDFESMFSQMTDTFVQCMGDANGPEQVIVLPEQVGQGELRRVRLRHGMEIGWGTAVFREPVVMDVAVQYPHMELAFTLEGSGYWSERGRQVEREMKAGCGNLIYMNDAIFHMEQPAGKAIDHMEIRIDFALWRHLVEALPWEENASFYCMPKAMSPAISAIVEDMRSCPYSGTIKQLYLEGKCFELLAISLHEAGAKGTSAIAQVPLKRSDMEALHQAREILAHTWREPPSLLQLARKVGLNDYKLKCGFKALFGTTVFGYVRQERMREARRLLEQGWANVTEAACLVGYSNISHFSSLFHRTYGYYPSDCARGGTAAGRPASSAERWFEGKRHQPLQPHQQLHQQLRRSLPD